MPYHVYFDCCGWPARVLFDDDGKAVIKSELWDPKNCKLVPDNTMNFTYDLLHIDRQHGIKDDDYVITEEQFNALVEKRIREDSAAVPVPVTLKPDDNN
jgi:hypothetical protein